MSSENRGDDYYEEPPRQLCTDANPVDMVAPDDMYAYMGDGGDYLYAGQWVTGETVASASERFADGLEALNTCVESGDIRSLEVSGAGVDEAGLFESSAGDADDQERMTVLYARHGGVIVLQYLLQTRNDKYSPEQRDHLTRVVLDKLTAIGHVEVRD
jgi:hypothetical protein